MITISETILRNQLGRTLRETHFENLGTRYQGKVRDSYRLQDILILITTDRISAFDHILAQTIPFKGQVLNQLAAFSFDATSDLVPNHVLSIPDPAVTVAKPCTAIPVEFVVRGYLAGHAWREYKAGRRSLCGVTLPEGLRQNSQLPNPILTPATKAASGHDEDISATDILSRGLLESATLDQLTAWALALFERGSALAAKQGLILVDTKYEFGSTQDGSLLLIDEVHTPDSSRYYYKDTYEELFNANRPQRQLSKEFVREWLINHGFMGKDGQIPPELPDDFRIEISRRYIELFEVLTGTLFRPDTHDNPIKRIENSLGLANLYIRK